MGIGNIARLPYLMGQYGGWVFLLAYVLALLLIGLPILVTEWALGRWMRDEGTAGFGHLAEQAGGNPRWRWLGGIALAGAAMVLSYYSVVAGWSMGYTFRAAAGTLGGDPIKTAQQFLDLAQDPERSLAWHTLFMVATCVIVAQGFREGMERAARYFVPTAFLVMLIIGAVAFRYGDPVAAADYLFKGDWTRLGWRGAVEALQQAFFTLALGFGAMLTLGAYLPANQVLAPLGFLVILLDTVFSLIAGFVLLCFVMSAGVTPTPGLTMLFQTLPQALPEGWIGIAIGTPFYLVLSIVTLLSAAALLEPLTHYLMQRLRLTRVFAAVSAAMLVWYLGLGSLLSFGILSEARLLGQNFFEWMQLLSTTLIAPTFAILMCYVVANLLPPDLRAAIAGPRETRWMAASRVLLRYPARLALLTIILYAVGVLDWFERLWS
jgi:NSS family neurotransmitter:Na+ symporter